MSVRAATCLLTKGGKTLAEYQALVQAAEQTERTATDQALTAYRGTVRDAHAAWIIDRAAAQRDYTLAAAGADLTYVTTAAPAIAGYLDAEATAARDLWRTNAQEYAAYWIAATDSYADEMASLAAGSSAPWAQYRADVAEAEADRVAVVAVENRQHEYAAADAAEDARHTEIDAERAKVVAEAQAGQRLSADGAQAAYNRAVAEANALQVDADYGPQHLGPPAAHLAFVYTHSLTVTGEPLDFAAEQGLDDFFGHERHGFQGDGYYLSVVSSMFHIAPAQDELGYTNSVYRFLGENLIRPVVGDDVLINATDGQIIFGTVAFSAALVLTVYALPAAVSAGTAPLLAAGKAAAIGAVLGALGGGAMNVCATGKRGQVQFRPLSKQDRLVFVVVTWCWHSMLRSPITGPSFGGRPRRCKRGQVQFRPLSEQDR